MMYGCSSILILSYLHMLRPMERTSQFARDEYVRSRHAARGLAEGVADFLFVKVNGRAVEQSISHGEGLVLRGASEVGVGAVQ